MTFPALIDWLDDRINPIVVKELRQAVKSRLVVAILMLFLAIQLLLLFGFLLTREAQGEYGADWTAGAEAFIIQQIILLWTIAILIPAYAAVRMGSERSDQNADLMFISTLSPASIIWGKFFATLLLGLLVFSTCAPFMTFTYLLRGIDIQTILFVLAMDLLVMLFNTMVALFLSSLPGARVLKFVYSFIGFMQLIWLTAMLTAASYGLVESSQFIDVVFEYWPVALCFIAGVFATIGLFYSYAVAIISPPTSNRMFPVRIFLFGLVVVTLGGAVVSSFFLVSDAKSIPLVVFIFLILPILCVQMWISMCEREHLGPRVRRAIPRSIFLRPLAFLLYTGSVGGVLFTTILIAGSLGICTLWLTALFFSPSSSMIGTRAEEIGWLAILTHVLMALYFFCYGQTAVLIRRYLLGNQIRPGFTWVIAALLVGLGTTFPPMLAYFAFNDQMRSGGGTSWWFIPNPFVSYLDYFIDGMRRGNHLQEFDLNCLWFLATWTALLALLSVSWVGEQLRAFRPPTRKDDSNEDLAAEILLERDSSPVATPGVEARA